MVSPSRPENNHVAAYASSLKPHTNRFLFLANGATVERVNGLLLLRFWYTLFALAAGVASITLAFVLAREQQRRLATAYAGFLASLWLIVLSFAMATFADLASGTRGLLSPAFLVNGIGSVGYIVVAPYFYHAVLGLPMRRGFEIAYRLVVAATVVFVGLLFIASARELAVSALNFVLFALVLYGIVLIGLGYRRITERSLRNAIRVFLMLAVLFFPLMFLEARPQPVGDLGALGAFTHFALPSFFALLSILSVPFALSRLNRPAFWADDAPTQYFIGEYGLSEREGEVLRQLCAGLSNRDIAEALFISPKTVENHLSSIFSKTGVTSRLQLLTLLLSNR